jgi:hypothetical protein
LELYRQQIYNEKRLKHTSSPPVMIHKIESEITEHKHEVQPSQASNDNQWNDWSTDSPKITDQKLQHSTDHQEPSVTNRLFGFFKHVTSPWSEDTSTNDWNDQNSPLQFPSEEPQQTMSSPTSNENSTPIIRNKIEEIISEYPDLFPDSNEDILNNLDQFISIIKNLQNQIKEHQKEIEHLIEERNQIKQEKDNSIDEYQSQIDNLQHERSSLMEQINQLAHKPIKQDIEIQTDNES